MFPYRFIDSSTVSWLMYFWCYNLSALFDLREDNGAEGAVKLEEGRAEAVAEVQFSTLSLMMLSLW